MEKKKQSMVPTLLMSRLLHVLHRTVRFLFLSCLASEVCSAALWPSGMYGLPMPKSGCPGANGFQWQEGYIYQDLEDEGNVTTVSPNSQLKGRVSGDVERYFCIKDNISATVERNRPRWPAGEYCIYQKGSYCPDGLQSGFILWDDEDGVSGTNKNAHAGVLPKGVFDHDTKIFFCCKTTSNGYKEPIDLPFVSPFYLMAFRPRCQEVLYTIHKMEYIAYDTENDHNFDRKWFPYPYGADFSPPTIHYCYYRECTQTMTALNGTFRSPYYPQNYNNKAWCKWHIEVPWNYAILITFDDVSLESGCCWCDFVNVWETLMNGKTVLIGSVCSMTTPQLNSSGNNVTVIFQSDASWSSKGFRARYQAIKIRAAKTTTSTTLASTQTNMVKDKVTTTSSSEETTQEISSTRESKLGYQEKTDPTSTTRGEGLSDTLDDGRESESNTSLIAGLTAALVVICAILAITLFCFHKKRRSRENQNNRNTPAVSFQPDEKAVSIYATPTDVCNTSSGCDEEENDNRYTYVDPPGMYNNSNETVKESDNPLYESESMATSARNPVKQSENPLYIDGAESGKTADAGMYESLDQPDPNCDEGIYSSLYERMPLT